MVMTPCPSPPRLTCVPRRVLARAKVLVISPPRLAGTESVTRANGYLQAPIWSGITVGPLLAGVLTAAGGSGLALQIDALAYGIGALALVVLPLRVPSQFGSDGEQGLASRMRAGLAFLRSDPELGTLVVTAGTMIAFANLANVAEVVFAERVLRAGSSGYAALVAAWTAAMVAGTLLAGCLPARRLAVGALVGTVCTAAGITAAGGPCTSGRPSSRTASVGWPTASRWWPSAVSSTAGSPRRWPGGSLPCTQASCSAPAPSAWGWQEPSWLPSERAQSSLLPEAGACWLGRRVGSFGYGLRNPRNCGPL